MSADTIKKIIEEKVNTGPFLDPMLSKRFVMHQAEMLNDKSYLEPLPKKFRQQSGHAYFCVVFSTPGQKNHIIMDRVKLAARHDLRALFNLNVHTETQAMMLFPHFDMLDMDEMNAPRSFR